MVHGKNIRMKLVWGIVIVAAALNAAPVRAQFDSGSDGSDGTLDCAWLVAHDPNDAYPNGFDCANVTTGCRQLSPCTFTIDLSKARDGHWHDTPGDGLGVYDSEQWAVVYKYTTINVPAYATVKFKNHRSGAAVVWLAQGAAVIDGEVNLNGGPGSPVNSLPLPTFSVPGPGGFSGGQHGHSGAVGSSGGQGPGGGPGGNSTSSGVYGSGTRAYGNVFVFPLIGGSGGTGTATGSGGGAGAGAILVASSLSITIGTTAGLGARVSAIAGSGSLGGSGGGIRLVAADSIAGTGSLTAAGTGTVGRIRVEAPNINLPIANTSPQGSYDNIPGVVFPRLQDNAPTLKLVSIDGIPAPSDPDAGILSADVEFTTATPSTLHIEATNIDEGVGSPVVRTKVRVEVLPERGPLIRRCPELFLRPDASGILDADPTLTFPPGRSEIQLRATWGTAGQIACTEQN